ncbi:hypothetical protein [Corallococcus carmarthensis]|uniref:hypothetical protein n=1 Tax=Corallococcus carmarthensis TaxID=2316728 RepID=UPI0011C4966D|nr:hypothetical protein [Corallococcus carmarthensis]NOK16427.1 hypothetical protein [Corallococcus carmarthensis]
MLMTRSTWLALVVGGLLGSIITWGFMRTLERLIWGKAVPVSLRSGRTLMWPSSTPGNTCPGEPAGGLLAGTRGILWSNGSVRRLRVESQWVEGALNDVEVLQEGADVIPICSEPTSTVEAHPP